MEALQAVERVGADEDIAVGDNLLPASCLLFAVLLGVVFTVELYEGDYLGIFLIPVFKFLYTLLILVPFVGSRVTDHDAFCKADTDNCLKLFDQGGN